MTYLARYQSGEHEQVWAELTALGEQVRQEFILSDALAVAYETMSRAGENVRHLVSRLQGIGYQFETSEGSFVRDRRFNGVGITKFGPYAPPVDNTKFVLDFMEAETGPWPLSLRAWYEVVGSVDLTGFHPDWPEVYTDPLVLYPIEPTFDGWEDDGGRLGLSIFSIAPDYYHKADVSGGGPYAIQVPDGFADALVLNEWHDMTLVPYLRECFRWGGFPGFDVQHPMNPQHLVEGVAMPPEHLRLLTSDLLPI